MNWFWHALWIAFVIIPVSLLWFTALIDAIVDPDLGIGNRILWVLVILILPIIGSLIYIVVRGDRGLRVGRAVSGPTAADTSSAGAPSSVSAQLESLHNLRASGALTEEEFTSAKQRVLA